MGPQGVPGACPARHLRFCASVGRVDILNLSNSVCAESTKNENL